ncbi:MAG TPA: methyltransferase domain-containing protein [Pilimelia sp.]|nr:methyltransferase domain-containing protein [Pilimelia sp.]
MLTVDYARLGTDPGDRVLDLGCGAGRHAFEFYRRGARVTAVDLSAGDVAEVNKMFAAMRAAGEAPPTGSALAVRGDGRHLPFADGTFAVVVLSEILEHVPDDGRVIAEAARVLRADGTLAVTVPRWWPERVCWALSDAYHQVEGGHVRIYRRRQLLSRLRAAALVPTGSHHAHALHSPYWWLRCLFGPDNADATLPRLYHKLLVHDIMRRPWWTRVPERLLNPIVGKSLVVYLAKAELKA